MRRQPPLRRLLALVGTIRSLQASGDGCACVDFAMPAMTCDDYIASPDGGEGWSALDGVSACGWIEANWPYGGGPADGYAGCDGCCCGARSDARGYRTAAEDAASGCDSWDALVATADCVIRRDVTISEVGGSSYTIASGASVSIRGAGEAYSTIAGSNNDLGMPIFILEDYASLELADLTIRSGHNSADAGAIRMEPGSTLTVSRVVFRGHVGRMGAIVANGAYDGAAATLAFYSTQFHENSAMHVKVGSGTTAAAFYDCTFGTLTDFDDGAVTQTQYGALFLEENARADLYSCDFLGFFGSPYTLWMHPSAVAHVYCTYPTELYAAYDNNGDTSAGTLVDYSGQGCPGQAPKATATPVCATATVSSPAGDNGCNYGACKSLASGTLNCAYDNSFCGSTEEWLTAAEVIDAGEECTCMNILNYPMNIGTCSSSGVYSPMAVAGHCSGGTAVCDADTDGHYFLGDTAAGATQFTACDLKCDGTGDATVVAMDDTTIRTAVAAWFADRRQPRRRTATFRRGRLRG